MKPGSPRWIISPVSTLLTRWMLRNGAIFLLVNGMIMNSSEDARGDAVIHAVKRVATVPHGYKPEDYYNAVCPQIVQIVQQIDLKAENALVYTGLLIIKAMTEFSPELGYLYFIKPTIDAFMSYDLTERQLEVYVAYILPQKRAQFLLKCNFKENK